MYKILTINTIEEVLALTVDQPWDSRNRRHRGYYLYRGLPNESFELKTSLQRNCGRLSAKLEPKILENFSKYTAIETEVEIDKIVPGARPCVQRRACNPTGGNPVK